ncbi:MAG: hypothetical protein GY851_00155, partial [bacterium]|nr:hypothetical protein [bacterium]
AWCASKMGFLRGVLSKYRLLTGSTEFDALLEKDSSHYLRYRLHGDLDDLTAALEGTAASMRINFEGYTSEVRYTDRVLRFPAMFAKNGMWPEGRPGFKTPDTNLLYATLTGDPGSPLVCPLNVVRWLTRPRGLAALVTDAGKERFEARLFHFGEKARAMEAELYVLDPGSYTLSLTVDGQPDPKTLEFEVTGQRTRVPIELPSRKTCLLRVARAG